MASAHCLVCGWSAEGDAATVDKAASEHTKREGHPTSTRLVGK